MRVLVVDDERLIHWTLRTALAARGHDVTVAESAAGAIAALEEEREDFAVVVLDYRLPDRQDLSLLDDVRRLSPSSAVLMMTAFADPAMRSGAIEHGARAVVDKPFQVKSFVSLIESVAS